MVVLFMVTKAKQKPKQTTEKKKDRKKVARASRTRCPTRRSEAEGASQLEAKDA